MKSNLSRAVLAALAAGLTTAAVAAEPVVLKPSPALATDIDAFPRLPETPGSRAAKRINRTLAQGDARVRRAAEECLATGGEYSEWTRTIEVTMRGPRYLGLLATDSFYCGGPHPDYTHVALVYDFATGAPVNWKRLLPAALAPDTKTDTAADGTVLGEVVSPAFLAMAVEAARAEPMSDPECADVLAQSTRGFLLWPDAQAGAIVVQPMGLPHVVKACAEWIVIAIPELRKLGVDTELVDAIEQAHRQGWYGKTAK